MLRPQEVQALRKIDEQRDDRIDDIVRRLDGAIKSPAEIAGEIADDV